MSGFREIVQTIIAETNRFDGPVYLINGDSHVFAENLNRPWSQFRDGEDAVELPVYQGRISPATWAPQTFNA